jgi:hypothetical protein
MPVIPGIIRGYLRHNNIEMRLAGTKLIITVDFHK